MAAVSFDDGISIGLINEETRRLVKRQLIGSLAAGLVILAGAAFISMAPTASDNGRVRHNVASVQQPTFVKAQERVASAELP